MAVRVRDFLRGKPFDCEVPSSQMKSDPLFHDTLSPFFPGFSPPALVH